MKVVIIGGGEVGFHVAKALSEEDYDNGMVANVLCEGCGFIEVDHKGEKVDRLDNRVRRFQGHPHDNNNEAGYDRVGYEFK